MEHAAAGLTPRSLHHRLRDAVRAAGGTVADDLPHRHVAPPVQSPFAAAAPVEHAEVRAVAVGAPAEPPPLTGFLDGVQRYALAGRFGLTPVVRAYVAAAVLGRDGTGAPLRPLHVRTEAFVVAPYARLGDRQLAALTESGLPVFDCDAGERAHPILDLQAAVAVVEQRREALEREVGTAHLAAGAERWLVVDGGIGGLWRGDDPPSHVLGIVKSHETQYLAGRDLEVALTLPAGRRTSVFARDRRAGADVGAGARAEVYSWYLRLWPWEDHDLLFGLVRLERPAAAEAVAEATALSRWILAERAPLSAPDGRWDRLLYPIRQVETYLRAQAGGWW